jgi:hypothetical protein
MRNVTVEQVEDPAEEMRLSEEMDRFREARDFLEKRRASLLRKYQGQWVAIHRRTLVAHDTRLRDVERELHRLGVHRGHVLLEFLTEEQQHLIL